MSERNIKERIKRLRKNEKVKLGKGRNESMKES